MFKLCVFDMDGTFVNTIGDIAAAMNRSLEKMGHKTYKEEAYCQMVGDGMQALCKRALPGGSDAEVQKLIELYKRDYFLNCCEKTVPYEGMIELVQRLKDKGIMSAILSNKPHDQVMEIAEKLFEKDLFAELLGKKDTFPAKPAPESLLYLMEKLGASKEETVYIGDSDVDIRFGKAAGVFTVGVAWGFRGEEELKKEGADAIAYSASELCEILMK